MKIRTSRGSEIAADFAFAPTTSGNMVVKLEDKGQALSEVCADFESVERFECIDEKTKGAPMTVYEGYTRLMRASRENGSIMLTLRREE